MKRIIFFVLAAITSFSILAVQSLNGKTFCRKLKGSLGNPNAEIQHCIRFYENTVSEDAGFWGNPPSAPISYIVNEQNEVIFGDNIYKLSDDGRSIVTIKGSFIKDTVLYIKDN